MPWFFYFLIYTFSSLKIFHSIGGTEIWCSELPICSSKTVSCFTVFSGLCTSRNCVSQVLLSMWKRSWTKVRIFFWPGHYLKMSCLDNTWEATSHHLNWFNVYIGICVLTSVCTNWNPTVTIHMSFCYGLVISAESQWICCLEPDALSLLDWGVKIAWKPRGCNPWRVVLVKSAPVRISYLIISR